MAIRGDRSIQDDALRRLGQGAKHGAGERGLIANPQVLDGRPDDGVEGERRSW
jgi:hypothetical protein